MDDEDVLSVRPLEELYDEESDNAAGAPISDDADDGNTAGDDNTLLVV